MDLPILTLEDTLAGQKDLNRLCSDRPLKTKEVFGPNAFYGNDFVLKKYAGLPQTYPLKVVIPHASYISDDYIWEAEVQSPLPAILCYSAHWESVCINSTDKVTIRSAIPFLYVVEMLKMQAKPERGGTIFFPAHSTHHITTKMDFEAMAEELIRLGNEFQPVTVCIYWRDFNLGHHLPFEERGLPIVSAGHMYDPVFLLRFYHLCSMHRYSASNEVGSQLFYSVKSGCSYFHLDTVKCSIVAPNDIIKRDGGTIPAEKESVLRSMFSTPRGSMTVEQMKLVDYYMGADFLKSPQYLRRQLLYAEVLDKVGFIAGKRDSGVRFVVPSYCKRTIMNPTVRHGLASLRRKVSGLLRTQ